MRKWLHLEQDGSISDAPSPCLCSFGILDSIALFVGSTLVDAGVGASTAGIIGTASADALAGAGVGALTDLKNPLKGAEFGAIAGGAGGLAGPLVGELGLGATATGAISGGLGGAVAGLATGRNPLTSALEGGVAGGLSSAMGVGQPSSPSTPTGGPIDSAVSTAAPASVPAAAAGGDVSAVTITPQVTDPGMAAASANPSGNFSLINSDFGGPSAAPSNVPAIAPGVNAAAAPSAGFSPSVVNVTPEGAGGSNPGGYLGNAASGAPAVSDAGMSGWLNNNRWAPSALALGVDALRGNQALPGQKQLQANAAQLSSGGNLLQSYIRSGTLPPGISAGIKEATLAAQAAIRSQYAAAGDSGSSAEAQDLAAVTERAQTQGANIAIQLLQQGVSETNMADQLYLELMHQALAQDQELGQALATFSAGLVPATPTPKTA